MNAEQKAAQAARIGRHLELRFADTIHRLAVLTQRARLKEWDGSGDNTPLSDGVEALWVMAEHDSDRAASARLMAKAVELQSALKRIELGAYGQCLECGQPIAPQRLRALPEASRCVTCEMQREVGAAGSPA